MKNLALKRIQKMKPYSPPLDNRRNYQGELLDFNERTGKIVRLALKELALERKIQAYPEYFDLEKKIADYTKVSAGQAMITNGSDQGIDLIFRTFTERGDKVIIPVPSFAMFFQCAQIAGNKIIRPQYKKDSLAYPVDEIIKNINNNVKLVIICNPNNPTGTLVELKNIERIAKKAKNAIVYVDEAYYEYSGLTAAKLIKKYPNIIISRTFSKAFGLASLRIGYLAAEKQYIAEMLKVRGPYDVNMGAYYATIMALRDKKCMSAYVGEVMNKAKPMVEKFFLENKIKFYLSKANFILFKPKNARKTYEKLKENGFLTRPQNKKGIEGTIRATIGTKKQMRGFIDVYKNKILLQKYAFLDRDGTLIYEPPDTYQIDSLKKLRILPGVISGLKKLSKAGYKLIIITNQDGLGTKKYPRKNFQIVQNKMMEIFRKNGVQFEQVFVCPHFPEDECDCRKPKLGLLKKFLAENQDETDWGNSFVCGDRDSDRQLAKNSGIRFVPMRTNGSFTQAIKQLKT